jgi:hypothetical protein
MVFQPGQSGNPQGTRGRKLITDAINVILSLPRDSDLSKDNPSLANKAALLAETLYRQAMEGNSAAIQEIINRAEGKPIQQIDVKKLDPFEELTLDDLIRLRDALGIRIAHVPNENRGTVIEAEVRVISTVPETERIPQPGQDET